MAIVQMQKVAVLAHQSLKEKLLTELHEAGMLEVSERKDGISIDHTEVQYRSAELSFAIDVLKGVASKETQAVAAKKATQEEVVHAATHTDIRDIIDKLHKLEESDTETERSLQETINLTEVLSPWRDLAYKLNDPTETETSIRIYGFVPESKLNLLKENLKREMKKSEVSVVSSDKGQAACTALVWKSEKSKFEEVSTTLGWSSVDLPEGEGTPKDIYEELQAHQKELTKQKDRNHAERVKLSVELPNLIKARTFLRWLNEKQSVREAMAETESTLTILGWMPKKDIQKLENKLNKISPAIAILKVKADEGEEVPVLLKNPLLVTPFESVTGLYGLPLSNEMDPTKALSPFFILYFALCLTDAGYGAVLALVFGIAIFKKKLSIEQARLVWLLFFGGIVTILVSIPFGGYFGLAPEQVPAFLTKQTAEGIYFKGQIWNLNNQSGVTFLQNLSLALGITHLFFGMFLAGWHKFVHGKRMEALWVDFTNHLILGAVIFYAVAPEHMAQIAQYVLYGSLVIFIWGKGYGTKWYLRPIMGTLGLINFVISLLSNGLSYLRILALGLVTGAIAAAVDQVAVEMGKLFPIWLAIPIIILVLVLGHLVSIALNTLGSFIHSGRLQFIEFFSQFFEGGGRGFTPFKRSTS